MSNYSDPHGGAILLGFDEIHDFIRDTLRHNQEETKELHTKLNQTIQENQTEIKRLQDRFDQTINLNQHETKRLQTRIDQFLIALIAMCLAFGTAFGALMYHVGEERSQPVTPSTTEQLQPQPSPTQLPQN